MTGKPVTPPSGELSESSHPPRSLEKQSPPGPTDPVALVTDVSTRSLAGF